MNLKNVHHWIVLMTDVITTQNETFRSKIDAPRTHVSAERYVL